LNLGIFEDIGWTILFYLKKVTYPKLIITNIGLMLNLGMSVTYKVNTLNLIVKYL
jgi:hypothetical protein